MEFKWPSSNRKVPGLICSSPREWNVLEQDSEPLIAPDEYADILHVSLHHQWVDVGEKDVKKRYMNA